MNSIDATHPETVVLVHRREKKHKCSVEPLRGRKGFSFYVYPTAQELDLENYVRLGFGGPVLSESDASSGLLILDATWRLAKRMENVYSHVPVRSLPTVQTAYPRVSKAEDDPLGGLATIEAIYAAFMILGRDTTGLLDEYHWAEEFLATNKF